MGNDLPANAPLTQVATFIREQVRGGCAISLTKHAREEMAADAITLDDVRIVLRGCKVIRREAAYNGWKYTAEGNTAHGESVSTTLRILLEAETGLLIITAWKLRKEVRR